MSEADAPCRFVGTRIISGAALEKLRSHKIPLAQVEDAAAAVIHMASDSGINGRSTMMFLFKTSLIQWRKVADNLGRSLAIMPREISAGGYVDLGLDDAEAGGLIADVQGMVDGLSIRVGTK